MVTGQSAAVSRPRDAVFAVLAYFETREQMTELEEKLKERLKEINQVDGNPVTLRLRTAASYRTDEGITDENIYEQTLQRVR